MPPMDIVSCVAYGYMCHYNAQSRGRCPVLLMEWQGDHVIVLKTIEKGTMWLFFASDWPGSSYLDVAAVAEAALTTALEVEAEHEFFRRLSLRVSTGGL